MNTSRSFCLSILLLMVFASTSEAQWVQTGGPNGGLVRTIGLSVGSTGDTTLLAGLDLKGIYRSTTHGATWAKAGPTSGPTQPLINAFASLDTVVFVGTGNGVYRSLDQGLTWNPGDSTLLGKNVYCFASAPDTTYGRVLFAGATNGGIFCSTDDGATWALRDSTVKTAPFISLLVIPDTSNGVTIWAGGFPELRCSHDMGKSWQTRFFGGYPFYALAALPTDTAGFFLFTGTNEGIFRSTDNGTSWGKVNFDVSTTSFACTGDSTAGYILFAGTYGGVFRSTDKGMIWSPANNGMPKDWVYSLKNIGGTLYAGTRGALFRSTNNGASWIPAMTGLGFGSVLSLCTMADGLGGADLFAACEYGGVFRSSDGGNGWTPVYTGLTESYIVKVAALGTNVFAATVGNGLFRSTNHGENWSQSNSGLASVDVYELCPADSLIFAGTFSGVYCSPDSGVHWSSRSTGLPLSPSVRALTALPSDSGRMDVLAGTYSKGVYRSTDGGLSWRASSSGLPNSVFSAFATAPKGSDSLLVFVGSQGYGVFRSGDRGLTWAAASDGLTSLEILSLAAVKNNGNGYDLFAGTYRGGVFRSSDYGGSWNEVNTGLGNLDAWTIAVLGSDLLIGTRYGGVWRRPLAEIVTSVRKEPGAIPKEVMLDQNYPNPFNPSTTIGYVLPHRSHVTLAVFNMLGQQVATLISGEVEGGYHEVTFNAAGLASGVYFYRMEAGNFAQTRKLMLVK